MSESMKDAGTTNTENPNTQGQDENHHDELADTGEVTTESTTQADADVDSLSELKTALDEASTKAEENWNLLLAAKAETDNIRKRAERDVQSAHKFALEKFIPDLLGVKDSLELGMDAAKEAETVEKFLEGSELTLKQLSDTLSKHGVVELNPIGEKLNPELHQAVSMQPSDEHDANTIITVIQKGYTLNERLIRPAMVIVAQ